ncbi:Nn.00g118090.m01.CDS01 [Neocucurbitaria sp. VM-36]
MNCVDNATDVEDIVNELISEVEAADEELADVDEATIEELTGIEVAAVEELMRLGEEYTLVLNAAADALALDEEANVDDAPAVADIDDELELEEIAGRAAEAQSDPKSEGEVLGVAEGASEPDVLTCEDDEVIEDDTGVDEASDDVLAMLEDEAADEELTVVQ